jgi:hypothetical protein
MLTRLAKRSTGDEGIALVTVILVTALVTTLVVGITTLTLGSLRSSSDHGRFEGAIAAAETGVDQELAALQQNQSYSHGPAVAGAFADADAEAERSWAINAINAQVAAGDDYTSTGSGEFIAIKPSDRNVIYSLGCDPACDAPSAKKRFLKVEYIFAPYKPGSAILTSGDLNFSSSVTVDVSLAAAGGAANVHTNGDATGTGCSQTVNGTVTSSGSYSVCGSVGLTGSGGNKSMETVPEVKPSFLHASFAEDYSGGGGLFTGAAADYVGTWYDLCPDGTIKAPGATPCSGVQLASVASGGNYRGWSYDAPSGSDAALWSMTSTSWGDGIYYVFQGDAEIERNTVVNAASVIAEAAPTGGPSDQCGRLGGNISAKLVGIQNAALTGVVFLADTDLEVTSNFEGGIGVFGAGDQIRIETSSNGITGTVIANDRCRAEGDVNEVKNAVVNYDKNVEVPLLDIIRTTQWLELSPNGA